MRIFWRPSPRPAATAKSRKALPEPELEPEPETDDLYDDYNRYGDQYEPGELDEEGFDEA